jgi:hypothetical protein
MRIGHLLLLWLSLPVFASSPEMCTELLLDQEETVRILRGVSDGTLGVGALAGLPQNRRIHLFASVFDSYSDRLLGGGGATPETAFLSLEVREGRNVTVKEVPLSSVVLDSVVVFRNSTRAERMQALDQLRQALRLNHGVRFVASADVNTPPRVFEGVVVSVERGDLHLATAEGGEPSFWLANIDPTSLTTFPIEAAPLALEQAVLLARLEQALRLQSMVAFLAKKDSGECSQTHLRQGRVVKIVRLTNGDRLVYLNERNGLLLSRILPGSVVWDPNMNLVAPTSGQDWEAPQIRGVLKNRHLQPLEISAQLRAELSALADPDVSTGWKIPGGLDTLLKPDFELELRFRGAGEAGRVTMGRSRDRDPECFLEFNMGWPDPDHFRFMEALRTKLGTIRSSLLKKALRKAFPLEYRKAKVLSPLHTDSLFEVLLKRQGYAFHLEHGLSAPTRSLTETETKFAAAVDYLQANGLVFSATENPQGRPVGRLIPVAQRESAFAREPFSYALEEMLFSTFVKNGLQFSGSEWR